MKHISWFIDDYETIRLHMVRYIETGSVKTPSHGRGKRNTKPNVRYAVSDGEKDDETSQQLHQTTQEKVLHKQFSALFLIAKLINEITFRCMRVFAF
jgi:hypothetical protein